MSTYEEDPGEDYLEPLEEGQVHCVYMGCGRAYYPAESTAPRPKDWCSAECQRLSFEK